MTGLIPAYLKTIYKKEPVFAHSKIVFTIGQNTFKEKLGSDFIKKALIHASLKEKDLEPFKDANNTAMFKGGATYADAITFGAEKIDKKLTDEFSKVRGKKTLQYNAESDLTDYLQLYNDLAGN
jgi:starch synthase